MFPLEPFPFFAAAEYARLSQFDLSASRLFQDRELDGLHLVQSAITVILEVKVKLKDAKLCPCLLDFFDVNLFLNVKPLHAIQFVIVSVT